MLRSSGSEFLLAMAIGTASSGMPSAAHAETIALTCSLTAAEQEDLKQWDQPTEAATTMHIKVDTIALTAADWATFPGDTLPASPTVYPAKITMNLVTWSTPPSLSGQTATRYLNRMDHKLNTVDPGGTSTMWDCA